MDLEPLQFLSHAPNLGEDLRIACHEVALQIVGQEAVSDPNPDRRPNESSNQFGARTGAMITQPSLEALTEVFFEIAGDQVMRIERGDHGIPQDPYTVVRAIQYLRDTGLANADEGWFAHSLGLLIHIATPRVSAGQKGEPFFSDLRCGLDVAERGEQGRHLIAYDLA